MVVLLVVGVVVVVVMVVLVEILMVLLLPFPPLQDGDNDVIKFVGYIGTVHSDKRSITHIKIFIVVSSFTFWSCKFCGLIVVN